MVDKKTVVSFDDIKFLQEKDCVKAVFMNNYYFYLNNSSLDNISSFEVLDGKIIFDDREKRVWNKFNPLLKKGFEELFHKVRNKPCIYIHKNSGIPLIGSNEFGLVDRGSNIIEVKPSTGCNLSCTFCSVDEGVNNKIDIVVEKDYLVEEFGKLASLKNHLVEANIGPQGEPLLYPKLVELVKDLKKNGASVVSINTNGTLLNEKLIDSLHNAGLDRINLSLHTLNQQNTNKLMGGVQNISRLKEMIAYCEGKIDVLLAPVLIPGLNDDDIKGIVEFSKKINNKKWPSIGIQNFLEYPGGRNPGVKQRSWDEFYKILKKLDEETGVSLMLKENIFSIHKDKTLQKPFLKGDLANVVIKSEGRNKKEFLGVASDRVITVRGSDIPLEKTVRVKILRDKHNIFLGVRA